MDILKSNLIFMCLSWLLILFLLPLSQGHDQIGGPVMFHGGPILHGEIKLAILWYGDLSILQKNVIGNFIESLNKENPGPSVASWWHVVESYQAVAKHTPGAPSPPIRVRVEKQTTDNSYKYGKVITVEYIPKLVQDAAGGDRSLLPVIFAGRTVTVHGLCYGKCADHGLLGTCPYVIVGDPESECPDECAYPFMGGPNLLPPSHDFGADAMVVAFAQALADVVTNSQLKSGFYKGRPENPTDIAEDCKGVFGRGGGPSNPGKLLVCPISGGSYNAVGNNGMKFLLPAIWNPALRACWTVV